jgi:hypothetical protein
MVEALGGVVGKEFVSDDLLVRTCYGRDPHPSVTVRKQHKDPFTIPDIVVLPSSTAEVQAILRLASEQGFNVTPMGSGDNLVGACVPTRSRTIILDMKRMDTIFEINERDRFIRMQPWNSYARVQAETMKRGLWNGGTPAAPATNTVASNCLTFGGAWQTAQAFGLGARSFLAFTVVLTNGDTIRTGSHGIRKGDGTYWYGPGPDLRAIWEMGAFGGLGTVTEVLFKLHTWPGGDWPQETEYGRPPVPANHRMFWYRFNSPEDCMKAAHEVAISGVGIGINIPLEAVTAMCGESHQAETERKWKAGFYEPHWMYIMCSGYAPGQLDYEESVIKEVMAECHGEPLSDEQRRHVENYNADCFRSGDFVRWIRCGIYAITALGRGPITDMRRLHDYNMDKVRNYDLPALNGTWPFFYSYDRGHFWMEERDLYGDQLKYADTISKITIDVFRDSEKSPSGYWVLREPMAYWYGKRIGPNYGDWLRKVKEVFDPTDTSNPDRLIFMRPAERPLPEKEARP